MKVYDFLEERKQRLIDHFYFWFGTDEYYNNKEPKLLYNKWICLSVEWELFETYQEAVAAIENKRNNG